MPVGGSRHYDGGGLGPIGVWHCPTCGEDNAGPMAEGCAVCGAGRPGRHIGVPPPQAPTALADDDLPRVSEREPDDPTYQQPRPRPVEERDIATEWAREHSDVTVEQAYRAGFLEGVRRARQEFDQFLAQKAAQQQPERPLAGYVADDMIQRTIVAALELFRDQVLTGDPEETTTGEWLTAHQVTALIAQMKGEVHG